MTKLFTVEEMKRLEKQADASGLTYGLMMENAGKSIAEIIEFAYSHIITKKLFSIVGSGNNGGDALVALGYLAEKKWETCAYILSKRDKNDPLINRLIDVGGRVVHQDTDQEFLALIDLLDTTSLMLDGVLGTGIKLPVRDDIGKVLSFIKQHLVDTENKIHVVAVDVPSGVDCDTGETSPETIPAEMTITMAGIKTGLIRFPAAKMVGEIRVGSIGDIQNLPEYRQNLKTVITRELVRDILPARPLDAHKGTFGTALIVAGSVNFTGAAYLAGVAAYRIGAGLVTLAIPRSLHPALAGKLVEATWVMLPEEDGVISADGAETIRVNLNRATAMLIGPGFGLETTTQRFLEKLFTPSFSGERKTITQNTGEILDQTPGPIKIPVIMDADGLKLMSRIQDWYHLLPRNSILTPHPGEMQVLTGLSKEEIQNNRIDIATKFAAKWGHVVILKGAYTIIAAPDGKVGVIPVATPALARAGTGDVLAGIIVGLRAQGVDAFQAACAGAWIHAQAGLMAAERAGNTASVIAGDLLKALPYVISNLI